jgi:hypothetical protein
MSVAATVPQAVATLDRVTQSALAIGREAD